MNGARVWRAIAGLTLVVGCGGDESTGPDGGVATVRISALAPQLAEGERSVATARVVDARGKPMPSATVQWMTSDSEVLVVSQDGMIEAVAPGSAWVRARFESRSDSARVTVLRALVASVALEDGLIPVIEGATRQLAAVVKGAAGQTLTGRGMQWSSSNDGVARVNAVGAVTALRPGRATIEVTVEGKTDAATLIVSADYDYDLLYDAWSGVAGQPSELYRVDVRAPGGMPARVMPGLAATDVAVSPDGQRLALSVLVGGRRQIYVAAADGTGLTRLTHEPLDDSQPAWSPDGASIAFRRWSMAPGGHADIMVMNADGSGVMSLTADHGSTNQSDPAWSARQPDGGWYLVYASQTNDASGQSHLWRMRADGSGKAQLTTGDVWDDQPAVSPDGATIVFQRHGIAVLGDLFTIGVGGGAVRALVGGALALGQFGPAWSPDGKLIAFASKHEGEGVYQIYTVWADGSKLARRTFDATDKQRPAWAPRLP